MVRDDDPSKWDCPPHTRAKHQMLGYYLDGWYPILSSWNGRILFLDGFAGRGRYNDGTEGSPLVALRRLLDHRQFPQMSKREFVFLFVEANEANAASLKAEIAALKIEKAPWPDKVKVKVLNATFDSTATAIIEHLREQKRNLAPTFAFVDPFGYSGMPIDVLADLLDYPRTEVLVNFMVGHVQRFIKRDGQERVMRELFGLDVNDILDGYDDQQDRVEHLRAVYAKQLQERAKLEYVQSFGMINDTGNIGYYLFHGTRHRQGVKLMKAAMWKVDPGSGNVFSDRLAGENVLFTATPDFGPLRDELLSQFAGRTVGAKEVEWHALLHTPYRETHVRPVLRPLESAGVITVTRPPGKTQFAEGVMITFPD
jgi:three-Cys-motif partner protein